MNVVKNNLINFQKVHLLVISLVLKTSEHFHTEKIKNLLLNHRT